MKNKKIKTVSIYSGCGGIDIGFEKAGFDIVFSTDYWLPACKTLEYNKISKEVVCDDIRNIDFREILNKNDLKTADCLIGGPPCPAYSKSRFYLKDKKRALEDENSYTLTEYFRAVEELNPEVFFFENVFGFIYKPHKAAFDYLNRRSLELGYKIFFKVVNTAFYGVAQTRERFICVGVKKNKNDFVFPLETHYNPEKYNKEEDKNKKPWVSCKDVIGDLDIDLPEDKNMQAGSKHKDLLKLVPPGDNYLYFTKERGYKNPIFKWRSRYWSFLLKLSPDRPSWTIQASHSNNMGPFHWKNRFLRIDELKRIQSFPDDYEILGSYLDSRRQIGNAVPPKISQLIAEEIKKQLF